MLELTTSSEHRKGAKESKKERNSTPSRHAKVDPLSFPPIIHETNRYENTLRSKIAHRMPQIYF